MRKKAEMRLQIGAKYGSVYGFFGNPVVEFISVPEGATIKPHWILNVISFDKFYALFESYSTHAKRIILAAVLSKIPLD